MALFRIEEGLCFEDIMTSEVLFYAKEFDRDCKTFCINRNITYLPWMKDASYCYKLCGNGFKKKRIMDSQSVGIKENIFQISVIEKFRKHRVLFVYRKSGIAGVVHFCDYNRDPVSIYAYAVLLELEKKLRNLLVSKGLKNDDMINFFLEHSNNRYYLESAEFYKKGENLAKMKEMEPFQFFCLKDLICLLNMKKIHKVPCEINDNLRNTIMHSKNVVKHKNYVESKLIYDFKSFLEFIEMIRLIIRENAKISNKIPKDNYNKELRNLKQAGLLIKL